MSTCRRFTLAQARLALRTLPRARPGAPCSYTLADLREGMNVEREHSDLIGCSPTKAARIAHAHLCERRDYYQRLERFVEPKRRRLR